MALVFKEGVKKHYVLCEKYSSSIVFGKGLRKTAARTLLFLSEAVPGRGGPKRRPGGSYRERTLKCAAHFREKR